MKIEVWSDYACPFCYIGKRRLEEALAQFPHKEKVEVEFKAFELDPYAARDTEFTIHELLAKKYGTSVEQAKSMSEGVGAQAATVGLDFKFDTMIPTNTLDAHRLAKFSAAKGKEKEMTERLLSAYFVESKHLGDHETLTQLAVEVGLDETEVRAFLNSDTFTEEVRIDEGEAQSIGVQGVPFFVVNQKYAISGAQPTNVFAGALQKVWEEEHGRSVLQPLGTEQGAACTDSSCDMPDSK
ncbi:DsbA family oxidoreductase [Metabacillus iocasae]|uniref:Protein disulfide-isomerase n=1 Tax=Priestia iocasae TaxID=2291674 RepID=A0ABS2QX87_9BACI|nr:DsbA family oxidoreductase [Metabacillus iocasae]MBM7703612.1 protein disulfide-isomerase [Metabacillus iocasae]